MTCNPNEFQFSSKELNKILPSYIQEGIEEDIPSNEILYIKQCVS